MTKTLGALLVFAGCGGFGFYIAASFRREEQELRRLASALDYMGCELQYRMSPLSQLCRQAAELCSGGAKTVLLRFSEELDSQISPDASACMAAALARTPGLSSDIQEVFSELAVTMGRFDLPGQLKGLEAARQLCRSRQEALNANRDNRTRSLQTLGLCAGAALAILFL